MGYIGTEFGCFVVMMGDYSRFIEFLHLDSLGIAQRLDLMTDFLLFLLIFSQHGLIVGLVVTGHAANITFRFWLVGSDCEISLFEGCLLGMFRPVNNLGTSNFGQQFIIGPLLKRTLNHCILLVLIYFLSSLIGCGHTVPSNFADLLDLGGNRGCILRKGV